MFRARELRRPEMGQKILDQLTSDLADVSAVESRSGMEGRFVTMVLGPKASAVR
jgi:translation initiation factor IF-3